MGRREDQRAARRRDSSELADARFLDCFRHVLQDLAEDDAVERVVAEGQGIGICGEQPNAGVVFGAPLQRWQVQVDSDTELCPGGESSQARAVVAADIEHSRNGRRQVLGDPPAALVERGKQRAALTRSRFKRCATSPIAMGGVGRLGTRVLSAQCFVLSPQSSLCCMADALIDFDEPLGRPLPLELRHALGSTPDELAAQVLIAARLLEARGDRVWIVGRE